MGETSKAFLRRQQEGFFDRYVKGLVIDIGCGDDPITADCDKWDMSLGHTDATLMRGVLDNTYNTVYSSHCLEHLNNPIEAVQNWYRILAPGGHLIICVPSCALYEKKKTPPSIWNPDHKTFWYPVVPDAHDTSRGLVDTVIKALGRNANVIRLSVEDAGWTDVGPDIHSPGEYQIEIIVRK